ncbi:MAG: HNH endonuclease [Rhodobacteraceae bacterium]|nr:MAG: HNH endonuclease [Paracoccaceae bacterium]
MIRKVCVAAGCGDIAIAGLSHCPEHEERRLAKLNKRRASAQLSDEAKANRKFYGTKRWRVARIKHLKHNPLCVDCGELGLVVPATDVDHIIPHKGKPALMWDKTNWQSLCHPCHSRKTAREVFGSR